MLYDLEPGKRAAVALSSSVSPGYGPYALPASPGGTVKERF
ncbi:MAG TPA: hypothetical protein VN786_09870 [Acidimicrobiales bacterium]|nr:hypothetical protein [Acidimicrobiales bacterium]